MIKVAFIQRHIGPYHHARLEALSQLCHVSVLSFGDMHGVAYEQYHGAQSYQSFFLARNGVHGFASVIDYLDLEKQDVIVLPGWSERVSLLALRWALQNNVPALVLSDSHEIGGNRSLLKEWIKSRVVRLFSAALVAGKPHVHYITKLGMLDENVFVGCDVVDNAFFQSGAEAAKGQRDLLCTKYGLPRNFFLASNRFLPGKNLKGILEAYARYRHAGAPGDWGLVLLGDGPGKATVQDLCEKLKIRNWVTLCGMRSYTELPVYYGLAGAFVHASFSETWGLVVNEAMSAGLPVLVSALCGCVPDLVEEGINGYSFDPYNTDELARHMIRMANGEYNLDAMGNSSLRIISHWTPDIFARNLMSAAQVTLYAPRPGFTVLDGILLWGLSRRYRN